MRSDDLTAGTLQAIEHDGTDVLVCRTPAGELYAVHAWCPHMNNYMPAGADPGRATKSLLRDGHVECPFHGWRFDRRGRCVHIPQGQRIPASVASGCRLLRSWNVREKDGFIQIGPGRYE